MKKILTAALLGLSLNSFADNAPLSVVASVPFRPTDKPSLFV